jgi:hypothetical protein
MKIKNTMLSIVLFICVMGLGAEEKIDRAPTPFTAEEIRLGCPDGRVTTYKIEIPGKPVHFEVTTFVNGTKETAGFQMIMLDKDGNPMGKKRTATAKWTGLQAHASFPASNTTITQTTYTTPAGTFDCLLYTVKGEKEGKPLISKYYFAKSLPGPPIYFTQETDGTATFIMTLMKNKQ